ncbi:hypothetical protein ACFE04_029757 [Oxalis oulophora]
MEFFKAKLGFGYGFMVAAVGRKGGLACLWNANSKSGLPLLVGGDFNEIICNSMKSGGCLKPNRQMESFRMVLEDCGLREIQIDGGERTIGLRVLGLVMENGCRISFVYNERQNAIFGKSLRMMVQ